MLRVIRLGMNKAQKQLLDTYFRKRKMAIEIGRMDYNRYELVYLMANDKKIDFGKLNAENIVWVLRHYPQKIDEVDLKKLRKQTPKIKRILVDHPSFYDRLNAELNLTAEFDGRDISMLLIDAPELINKLDTTKLQGYALTDVIVYNPGLVPILAERGNLDSLIMKNVRDILATHPDLLPYFEEHIRSHNAMFNINNVNDIIK